MKIVLARFTVAVALLTTGAAYGGAASSPRTNSQTGYFVVNLASLGGTNSGAISINDRGWVSGFSTLSGDEVVHAALWLNGAKVDLRTLGGDNSGVEWPVKNTRGMIAGISQTSIPDPRGEHWSCSAFIPYTGNTCLGFAWRRGVMHPLPPFEGGNNSYATGANNRGQIVGWAENGVEDPTCVSPQVLQFEAVIWGPHAGQMQELAPYGDDPDGAATAINRSGEVVGISGECGVAVGGVSAAHALLWQDGTPIDLGNFGGSQFNTPSAINNRGDITGWSDLAGDAVFHAFIWTQGGGLQDIGVLPGDTYSLAYAINDEDQIVGESCDADFNCRAFLWQDGAMINLNDLIPPSSPDYLIYANDINDWGDIVGGAEDQNTGNAVAFLAIKVPHHGGQADLATTRSQTSSLKVTLPLNVRREFLRLQQGRTLGRMNPAMLGGNSE